MWLVALFAAAGLCSRAPAVSLRPAACSCVRDPDVRDRAQLRNLLPHTVAVFEGIVVGSAPAPRIDGPNLIAVRVVVGRRWRGGGGGDTVLVATPASPTACGTELSAGERYLIFATSARERWLFTMNCVPTRQWDAVADRLADWLGPPEKPRGKSRAPEA